MPCEYKIGLCKNIAVRWQYYIDDDSKFVPHVLFLLAGLEARVGAAMLESALIAWFEDDEWCRNTRKHDVGGSGPIRKETMFTEHYVYLAVVPK